MAHHPPSSPGNPPSEVYTDRFLGFLSSFSNTAALFYLASAVNGVTWRTHSLLGHAVFPQRRFRDPAVIYLSILLCRGNRVVSRLGQ